MERTALIILASMTDRARIQANAIDATAATSGVYGKLSEALKQTLALIEPDRADDLYQSILDGNTVTEALAEMAYADRFKEFTDGLAK